MTLQNSTGSTPQPIVAAGAISQAVVGYASSTATTVAGILRGSTFLVARPLKIANIYTEVATALAGSFYRVGIFSVDSTGLPNNLVPGTDVTQYSGATVGVKQGTLVTPVTIEAGLYIVGVWFGSPVVMRSIPVVSTQNVYGRLLTMGNTGSITHVQKTLAFVANTPLPTSWGAGNSFGTGVANVEVIFAS